MELAHQPHALGSGFDHLAVHARRAASGIDLRDLANAQNQVRITPQQELLKVADLLPLLLLRRTQDPLPQVRHLASRQQIGRCRPLMIGAAAFGVASVLAAFSTSAVMLIATHAVLGVAAECPST